MQNCLCLQLRANAEPSGHVVQLCEVEIVFPAPFFSPVITKSNVMLHCAISRETFKEVFLPPLKDVRPHPAASDGAPNEVTCCGAI